MQGEIPGDQLNSKLHMLADLGHQGYFHLLNCSADEVWSKLISLKVVFPDFDLILASLNEIGRNKADYVMQLTTLVAPGGAIVLGGCSTLDLIALKRELAQHPEGRGFDLYKSDDDGAGMLLKRPKDDLTPFQEFSITSHRDELRKAANMRASHESARRKLVKLFWGLARRLYNRYKDMN